VKQNELSFFGDGKTKWYGNFGTVWQYLTKLNTWSKNPAIASLVFTQNP
jgi:hypothetical protein